MVECWLRVREVPGPIPSQGPRYKNGTSNSLVWHSTLKREILALSQELRWIINVMDEIWDRKSLEVGGHWPLWRG